MQSVLCYLSLGSNMGDRRAHLKAAVRGLAQVEGVRVLRWSPLYHTRPVGKVDQDWFLNQVVEVETTLAAEALLEVCQRIEKERGRERHERWGPRTLDIDVLVYGTLGSDDPHLTLPHPRMLERAFVLVPLADLNAGLSIAGRTVRQHLASLAPEETDGVVPYDPGAEATGDGPHDPEEQTGGANPEEEETEGAKP